MADNTPNAGPLWLVEDDVRRLVSLNDAIDALDEGLRLEATGSARNIDKALGQWDSSSMHALGSMMPDRGYVAYKTWANTPLGAAAVVSLFSANDGRLLAMIEAAAIGGMRTAAISGLATRLLADKHADQLALIGTGMQAVMQVAAIAAVRPLKKVRVFSPNPASRSAFLAKAAPIFSFPIEEATSVAEAVYGMPIVTTITRAKSPFLSAAMLAESVHINAPGAILPGNAEIGQDVFRRADQLVVDSKSNAVKSSRELIEYLGTDIASWTCVDTLGELLANNKQRSSGASLTLFKSMGTGLADLSVSVLAYERASAAGCGLELPQGRRAPPRFTALV